ncbi:MAG: HTH-type transcriptional activator IlvY [Spirochaetales bacterium]|nr:HTH-type transcriptional activator IlvY [Spirochaetales bacterium]
MDFHSLELFLHLSSSLHFARTSQVCNISPSALSRTIQRLEMEIGSKLFIRDNRSAELTDEGKRFQNFARDIIGRWEEYQEETAEENAVLKGEVKIYSSVTASYSVLTQLFSAFRRLYPEVHINLQTGAAENAISMIQDGIVDITVAARPDRLSPTMRFKSITETPLVLISPVTECEVAQMVKGDTIPWNTVPMILPEQGLSRRRVDAWFRSKGIRPNIYAEVAGHEAIISMVHLGCGIGIVPLLVLETSSIRQQVNRIRIRPFLKPYSVGLCVMKKRLEAPAVRAFWDLEIHN